VNARDRLLALPLLAALLAAAPASAAPARIAYQRGNSVWVADADGAHARRLAAGDCPELSPDGRRIACNTNGGGERSPVRRIAMISVATGVRTVLRGIPSDNCFGPTWSPDGTRLLFSAWIHDGWQVALVNADGSGFRAVLPGGDTGHSWYGAAWAADGESFFAENLDTLARFALDGTRRETWPLREMFPHGGLNSGARLSATPDGRTLLVDVDMDEADALPEWDGPPPAIWALDLASGQARRVTEPGFYAWECQVVDAESIVFLGETPHDKNPVMYRGTLAHPATHRLARDVRTPSAAPRGAH
jgi:TolB protein